MTVVIR